MKNILIYLIVVVLTSTFISCEKEESISVTDVILNQNIAVMTPGEKLTLTARMAPDNATNQVKTWMSSNSTVATVGDGTITAVAEGTAEITVTTQDGGKTAICNVTVTTSQMSMDLLESRTAAIGLTGSGSIAIDWGDGTENDIHTLSANISNYEHSYTKSLPHTITIKGANITRLTCTNNQLVNLDVSRNIALEEMSCGNNLLSSLDVSKNTKLTYLSCRDNQITSLNLNECTLLTTLNCRNNQLTDLAVNECAALKVLECNDNLLTNLNLAGCTTLRELNCNMNRLTSLDLNNNVALRSLSCDINRVTSLDLSNNTMLTSLSCNINRISSLDVTNNKALTFLSCDFNQLENLDLRNNTALIDFICSDNQLISLDMSNSTMLKTLSCQMNDMSDIEIDILFGTLHSNNIEGKTIDISNNPGTVNCIRSIATGKGWIVITD